MCGGAARNGVSRPEDRRRHRHRRLRAGRVLSRHPPRGGHGQPGVALVAGAGLARGRCRWPLAVLAVVTVPYVAVAFHVPAEGIFSSLAYFVALYSAGAYGQGRRATVVRLGSVAANLAVGAWALFNRELQPENAQVSDTVWTLFWLTVTAVFLSAAWLLGDATARPHPSRRVRLRVRHGPARGLRGPRSSSDVLLRSTHSTSCAPPATSPAVARTPVLVPRLLSGTDPCRRWHGAVPDAARLRRAEEVRRLGPAPSTSLASAPSSSMERFPCRRVTKTAWRSSGKFVWSQRRMPPALSYSRNFTHSGLS